ncbi:MAG: CHAT domain-containing protein [Proteobacteria bacterium]|nr:CHAT domain-containing protein [Pseudomonadota bacterium]
MTSIIKLRAFRVLILLSLVVFLSASTLSGKELSASQIKKIEQRLEKEKDLTIKTKLVVLLIKNAVAYKEPKDELEQRDRLYKLLDGKKKLRSEHHANLYRMGSLNYESGALAESFTRFEQLLKILPRSEIQLRNLILQHLSLIAAKLGKNDLEEKYLSLFVIAKGKVSKFYETSGGYEKLLQMTTKTGSKKEHYYFEKWHQVALQNGSKKDQKKVLTQWVNYTTSKGQNFAPKPFELLLAFFLAENALTELQDLRMLYAQSTPDEARKLAIYEEIRQHNQRQEKPTKLGILTRLFKAYKANDDRKKEQEILGILAAREDYQGRQEALKQLALLSLKNEDWILSLKSHQKLLTLTPFETSKEGLIILDNLISITQKLSKDALTLQYLRQKALTASQFVEDSARYKAFTIALALYRQNRDFETALELYQRMTTAPFHEKRYSGMYEIHLQCAMLAEEKEDYEKTLACYQHSLDSLLENGTPKLDQALKIAQKILLLSETHFPGQREIAALEQIKRIHRKRNNLKDIAKTELIIAQKLEKSSQKKEAVAYYNQALESYRRINDAKMVEQLITLLTNLEEGSSGQKLKGLLALEESQQASKNVEGLVVTRTEIGNYYKSQNDPANAAEYYLKAANTDGSNGNIKIVEAAYYGGILLSGAGDLQRSNAIFGKALENETLTAKNPELFTQIRQAYSKNLNQQGKIPEALNQIERALELKVPKLKSTLIYTKATIQINDNQYAKAETALKNHLGTVKKDPEKLPLLILLAKAQLGRRNFTSALSTLDQAYKIHGTEQFTSDLYDILRLKSYALSLKKDLPGAIDNQKHLVGLIERSDLKEKLGPANLELTNYYFLAGRLAEAFKANKDAQNWVKKGTDDSLRVLLNFAKISQKQSKLVESQDYFARLDKQIVPESSREIVAEMHYQRGFTYLKASNFEAALQDFQKSEKAYQELGQTEKIVGTKTARASVLMNLGKMSDAEGIYLSLMDETKGNLGIEGDVRNALAFLYSELGQYGKALKYSETAEGVYGKANQKNRKPEILNARGLIFLKMNDFDQAEITFLKALKQNAAFSNPLLDAEITNNLGGLYKSKGELDKARNQLMKTAELQKKLGFDSLLALTYNNIGSVYLEEKKYEEALNFLRQSRVFAKKYNLKRELAISWNNEGILFFKQEKYAEAEKAFDEAIKLQKELELRIELARTLNNLSIIASKRDDFKKALELVQKAVSSLSLKRLGEDDFFPNPDQKSVLAPNLMKDFLQNKGGFLRKLSERSKENKEISSYLEASYRSFALAIELIEALRAQMKGEESQKLLMQANIDIFQQLVAILYELGNRMPGKEYHEKAFFYAEMSRARSFLDQLQEQVARTSLSLPKEIRDRENDLKNKIADLDKKIFVELKKPQEERQEAKIEQWQIDKTELLLKYRNFTKELEERFPAYASLKYPKVYDVETVKKELLDQKTQVITYFLGEDLSYGWTVGRNTFSMVSLPPNADIDQLIRKYRKTLVNPLIMEDEEDEEMIIDSTQSHVATGLQIYRKVLDPLLKDTGKRITQLVLIPDGVLYYLPFETVLTQIHLQSDKRFPHGREYMLHRYSIHYSPSVSVLGMIHGQVKARNVEQMAKRKDFVGFGDPEYKPDEEEEESFDYNPTLEQQGFYELDRLFNSRVELKKIATIFSKSNTTYLREKAKESTVKSSISGYKYIHFATHGILDERNPEFSGVVMNLIQKDKPEDGFLQASEIFDLKINSDLVILSACETGLGKVIKGEGMVGLTRAFLFAGTPSIVVSLWTVADESTSKLMIYFYEFLNKGYSKDDALRRARIALMDEKDDDVSLYTDPFYWGPFILNGTRI